MKLMVTTLYDALVAAGAPDEKARQAASDIAEYKDDMTGLRTELADIRSRLRVLEWMGGTLMAGVLALVIKAFM